MNKDKEIIECHIYFSSPHVLINWRFCNLVNAKQVVSATKPIRGVLTIIHNEIGILRQKTLKTNTSVMSMTTWHCDR